MKDVAARHYEGSRSKAINGMVLHEWMVETHKKLQGKPHDHWLSAPLVLHPEELEPILSALAEGRCDEVGSYMEALVSERSGGHQWSEDPPVEVGAYWWKQSASSPAEIVVTTRSELGEIMHGGLPAANSGGLWYGPLKAPGFSP